MDSALSALSKRSPRLQADLTRLYGRPTLQELRQVASVFSDAVALLQAILPSIDPDLFKESDAEFAELDAKLSARREEVVPDHRVDCPVQLQRARALYLLVRQARPLMMVETGVTDGYSTAVVVEAMEANGIGELHSFGVHDDVGALIQFRDRWTLHVLPPRGTIRQLRRELVLLAPVDIFVHDSDQGFVSQAEQYALGFASLCHGGYLVSSDVDFSYAYREEMIKRQLPNAVLLDSVKCSAIARLI